VVAQTRIFTIGFTKKTAANFFNVLTKASVERVIDTRLNNVSQLAGFTKRDDLRFFLKSIAQIDYVTAPLLAPTQEMLSAYRGGEEDWISYEAKFLNLMAERHIEDEFEPALLDMACLLCSEPEPVHCHRRLVAEYLQKHWGDVEIVHLT
jgi:uncharacterized protein (DUF488 family)